MEQSTSIQHVNVPTHRYVCSLVSSACRTWTCFMSPCESSWEKKSESFDNCWTGVHMRNGCRASMHQCEICDTHFAVICEATGKLPCACSAAISGVVWVSGKYCFRILYVVLESIYRRLDALWIWHAANSMRMLHMHAGSAWITLEVVRSHTKVCKSVSKPWLVSSVITLFWYIYQHNMFIYVYICI